MADVFAALQSAGAGGGAGPVDIASALNAAGTPSTAAPSGPPGPPPTAGQRFVHGAMDLPTGAAQLEEHIAETPLNGLRWVIRKSLDAAGQHDAAQLFNPVGTADFDRIVQQREQDYQQARTAAGQTGIDWWRIGGQAAASLPFAGGGAASTVAGRIGQSAAQGAAQGLLQPSADPSNFWWDKAKGAGIGGVTGGAVSGVIESVMPVLRGGINAARNVLGANAAQTQSADAVVNSALRARGIDPSTIDLNVLGGLRQEAQEALEHGGEPSAVAIANRATAESLPIPMYLTRGMATRDSAQYANEMNLRGIKGVGEPLMARYNELTAAAQANLDALGAKDAPDIVTTGTRISADVKAFWDKLDAAKNQAYAAVRNSRGQSAAMDGFTAVKGVRDAMDTPAASHAYELLPSNIKTTLDDIETGKLPLTVAQWQNLDHTWGTQAAGAADGSVGHAINQARRIFADAPIQDDVGAQAMQAYKVAKQAHAQQMSLTEPKLLNGQPNPNFQPLVKAVVVDGKAPETLFGTHFMNAAPSVAKRNMDFWGGINPDAQQLTGRTLMGAIKADAMGNRVAANSPISEAKLSTWANEPVSSARLDALLPGPQAQTFRNLAHTVENVQRAPDKSPVNYSGTGSALVNAAISTGKRAMAAGVKMLPVVGDWASRAAAEAEHFGQVGGVQGALRPGVTLGQLAATGPAGAATRRAAAALTTPAAITLQNANQRE